MDIPSRKSRFKHHGTQTCNEYLEKTSDSVAENSLVSVCESSIDKSNEEAAGNSFSSLSSCVSSCESSLSVEDELNTNTKFQRFRPVLVTGNQKQTSWEYSLECVCRNGINASVRYFLIYLIYFA